MLFGIVLPFLLYCTVSGQDWKQLQAECGDGSFPYAEYTTSNALKGGKVCTTDNDCMTVFGAGGDSGYRCRESATRTGRKLCCSVPCPRNSGPEWDPKGPRVCSTSDANSCRPESLCYLARGMSKAYCCQGPFACLIAKDCDVIGTNFECPNGYCKKICPDGQFAVGNKCYQPKKLNDACEVHAQCRSAFTRCTNGRCSCYDGMTSSNGKCGTEKCITGADPTKDKDGKILRCGIASNPGSFGAPMPLLPNPMPFPPSNTSSCPAGSGCLFGLCCPVPANACPSGGAKWPEKNTNSPPIMAAGRKKRQFVPENIEFSVCPDMYDPQGISVNGDYISICCPRPCQDYKFLQHDGACYERKQLTEECEIEQQCNSFGVQSQVCKATTGSVKKTCQCAENSEFIPWYQGAKAHEGNCQRKMNESCKRAVDYGTQCGWQDTGTIMYYYDQYWQRCTEGTFFMGCGGSRQPTWANYQNRYPTLEACISTCPGSMSGPVSVAAG